jgi:hypothetical protein
MRRTTLTLIVLFACALAVADDNLSDEQRGQLAEYFGFGPMQVYRLKDGISELRLADLNADGRTDVALWNGWESRIEVFFQPEKQDEDQSRDREGADAPRSAAQNLERNEIPDRGDLRRESVAVPYRIASMQIGDLTGDGRNDIVFFGEPKELVVLPGREGGQFGSPRAIRAQEGAARPGSLTLGDFNADGRTDVALLADERVLIFEQTADGTLNLARRLIHGVSGMLLALTGDVNGDGRDDLLVGVDDDSYGMLLFLQDATGGLSAMRRLRVAKVRSITLARREGGDDVFCIEATTNRLRQLRWQADPGAAGRWPVLRYFYPLVNESQRRPIAVGDVTGDGRTDVVAADPDAARLVLFRGAEHGLASGAAFPGLSKTLDVRVADLDGDGQGEVLSISSEERMLGVSRYAESRLSFPEPLPIEGVPLAAAVGALTADEHTRCLAYLTRIDASEEEDTERSGRGDSVERIVIAQLPGLEPLASWEIERLGDEPGGLRFGDVNQDGRMDLLLFVRYSPLRVYVQSDSGAFERFGGRETREELVRTAEPEDAAWVDVTGDGRPELLLAQKKFVRSLVVREGRWTVVDQYNPQSADARLHGIAAVPGKEGSPRLVTYDRESRELLVMQRRPDGAYDVAREIDVGAFDVSALTTMDCGDDGTGVLLADPQQLALLQPDEAPWTLVEVQSYETDIKDAALADSVVGDLNHDGIQDVIAVDRSRAHLEILTTLPGGALAQAMYFQVFQGKRFSAEPERSGEPREVLVGDVTGDQIDDIVLLVHDRLIVYPGQ